MEKSINEQKQLASQLKQIRLNGDLPLAISICQKATAQFPTENFFFKILGDLQYDCHMYKNALDSYLEFILRIKEKPYLVTNLFRFIKKLRNTENTFITDEILSQKLMGLLGNTAISKEIQIKLVEYIAETFVFSDADIMYYIKQIGTVKKDAEIKRFINQAQQKHLYTFFFMIGQQLGQPDFRIYENNYKIIVSAMEKNRFHPIALKLTEKMLKSTKNGVVVRTLFRLCRFLENYSAADKYLKHHPNIIEQGDFNIQYELVYYFKEKKNHDGLLLSLNKMKNSAQGNPAISKTLYNFFLQFEMLSEAEEMIIHMEKLARKRTSQDHLPAKGEDTAAETDEGVWFMLRNIVSEKEHNRQLIATKDLIKGFSHELGQPLTNIRYDIGYYFMKKKYGKNTPEDIDEILNNILRQISRIDKLLKRFSPIFSSKSSDILFPVKKELQNVFDELSLRLESNNIRYTLTGTDNAKLYGDPLKFHQIFYNLIINSIHSIRELNAIGHLDCFVKKGRDKIIVEFSDNGKGIPKNLTNKIFDPFFSTKQEKTDHTKDDGGEGLGLYIVWHIVKMFNGTIQVNNAFKNGAQFILEFLIQTGG